MFFNAKNLRAVFLKSWRPYAWIAAAGFLLYFKTLWYGLTYFDDNVWIEDYQWFMGNASNALRLFTRPDIVSDLFYRPVLALSFMFNASLAGGPPFLYHLTNLAIHLANSCLIFLLLKSMSYSEEESFVCGIIFCVHPVLTQAVVWIPGRTDSLLSLFLFLSFFLFIRYLKEEKTVLLIFHSLLFAAALLVKETAVVFPAGCLGFFYLIFRPDNRGAKLRPALTAWAAILAVWFLVRHLVLQASPAISLSKTVESVWGNLPAVVIYAGKMMYPVNLSVLPVLEDMTMTLGWITILILAALILLSPGRRLNYLAWGIFWTVIFILPSLVVSFIKHEYRVYLPMLGFLVICLETGMFAFLKRKSPAGIILICVIIFLLAMKAFDYSSDFKDRMTFWKSAVRTSPHSPLAHRNLGAMYYLDGGTDEAVREYRKALVLNPKEMMVYNNLGIIYQVNNMFERAEEAFKTEISNHPGYTDAYFNLGVLYFKQGKLDEAEALWKRVIDLNDGYISAYRNLIALYTARKDKKKASYYIRELKRKGVSFTERPR